MSTLVASIATKLVQWSLEQGVQFEDEKVESMSSWKIHREIHVLRLYADIQEAGAASAAGGGSGGSSAPRLPPPSPQGMTAMDVDSPAAATSTPRSGNTGASQ